MLEKSALSHLHEMGCIDAVTDLACKGSKVSDSCFKSGEIDSVGNEFCTDDQTLCQFQLPDISSSDDVLEFFRNEQQDDECQNIFDYGWPDIGNFEDVDQMFRNCDSTYGQQNGSTADEPSWFSPSSHAISGTEEAFKLGFRSKFATDPKCSPDGQCPVFDDNQNNMSGAVNSWTSDIDDASNMGFYSYTSRLDDNCQNKRESASREQGNDGSGGEESKMLLSRKVTSGSFVTGPQGVNKVSKPKQLKNDVQSERKRKERSSEMNGSVTYGPAQVKKYTNSLNPEPLQDFSETRKCWESSTMNYLPGHNSYVNVVAHHYPVLRSACTSKSENKNLLYEPSTQTPNNVHPLRRSPDHHFKPSVFVPGEKVQKFHQRRQLHSQYSGGSQEQTASHTGIDDETPTQKQINHVQDELGGDSEAEVTRVECLDSSAIQDSSSCMSSVLSNGISPEAASFQQLQDVMEQLDIKTKLCIRDSLYRLARSAEQRHMNSSIKNRIEKHAGPMTDETNKCVGFMDAETNTNPIDRSIAHLLFSRPPEPSLGASSDALSLESHIMVHGCRTNQPEMHDGIDDIKDAEV
ncbi:protein LNK1-like [Aristolochia californica]|uniref:protein LNK1-like n=1 Tax=Aristolochia californica TaxID=171875 RepID=UPI0035E0D69B